MSMAMAVSMSDSSDAINVTDLPLSNPPLRQRRLASMAIIYTTWYYLAAIGVAALVYPSRRYHNRKAHEASPTAAKSPFARKVPVLICVAGYRHLKGCAAD
ncbi:hypothetical protein GGS23DRAFT_598687 [Durotheca rogersii]|uniref:uncharacterized protein n=1 Tax=Durotheca rogersii TaxID=419775 RepID=UPI0022202916|nr:uncharacterized protein GGS23DRAFT_598687 [Durotheca rogersii]KAI5861159.1 hypothetical protein GGS23DRAFT_598687 [Durotheca rogersii]